MQTNLNIYLKEHKGLYDMDMEEIDNLTKKEYEILLLEQQKQEIEDIGI